MNDAIRWVTLPQRHTAGLVGLTKAQGLIRVQLHGETMFLGCAAKGGLGARLRAYGRAKGTGKNHHAGRLIYERRADVEMQIAVMDKPAEQIELLLITELAKQRPLWNVPDGHRRKR